ncbi:MAG: hypothetical protein AAF196_13345 [Planctomycetota bacterium]
MAPESSTSPRSANLASERLPADQTAIELLFEHGYNVRDVLRCLHDRVKSMPVDEALAVASALQSASSALGRLCAAHPADAHDHGL